MKLISYSNTNRYIKGIVFNPKHSLKHIKLKKKRSEIGLGLTYPVKCVICFTEIPLKLKDNLSDVFKTIN